MTISSETRKAGPFTGNDITDTFPFVFKVFAETDVAVIVADADGVESTYEIDADYTITLNEMQDDDPGGDVVTVVPLPDGYTMIITSNIPQTNETELTNSGGFYPGVLNPAFDKLTILVQQLSEKLDRAVTVDITSTDTPAALMDALLDAETNATASASAAAGSASDSATSATSAAASASAAAASAAAAAAFDPAERMQTIVEFRHDGGSSSDGGFGTSTSGGGYGYTPNGGETSAAYGGVTTSTSASGRAAQRTGNTSFNSSIGPLYYMHQQAFFTALSDGTNSYISYSGFTDSSTGDEPSNGAYFEYNKSESDYWQCVTAAGGLRTKTVTSVLAKVLASGSDKLQVKIQGGVAKFWINGTLVHTGAAYIPSGWSQPFGAMATIRKTGGTSARIFAWDMLYARQILTTPRDLSEPVFA